MEFIFFIQVMAALFGFTGVLLGAFGAHYLKKKWEADALTSFETGVRYQLLHAVLLIVLGFNLGFGSSLEKLIAGAFVLGILLFSFSIYVLAWRKSKGSPWRWLGPVTPLGGLLLLVGWGLLGYWYVAHLF